MRNDESIIRDNFLYFQKVVGEYIPSRLGQYALLHSETVVGFFPKPMEAAIAGTEKFGDGAFSVQRVIDKPADLGFLSYGGDNGPTL